MITTPRQLTERAEFFRQLGALTEAGFGLTQALESLSQNPPSRSLRLLLPRLRQAANEGLPLSAALQRGGFPVPALDLALLEAGEQSGRLDVCLKTMAEYYEARSQMARQIIRDLAYPAFVLHFAAVLFPFISFFQNGDVVQFVGRILVLLAPIYILGFLIVRGLAEERNLRWRGRIERVLSFVPLVGTARRQLALSRLSLAMEALLSAGVPIIQAWQLASLAGGSPAIQRRVASWAEPLDKGALPSELVSRAPEFPQVFSSLYQTGEVSGKLDETLRRLRDYYREEGTRKMAMAAQWTPKILYFGVVAFIAYKVIAGWTAYFDTINKIME